MKYLILLGLSVVAVYDLVTTIVGTISILGSNQVQIGVSVFFGLIISFFLLNSYQINSMNKDSGLKSMLGLLWFLALLYDLWTSFTGNNAFIIQTGESIVSLVSKGESLDKALVLAGLTVFVTSSPILISYLTNSSKYLSSK